MLKLPGRLGMTEEEKYLARFFVEATLYTGQHLQSEFMKIEPATTLLHHLTVQTMVEEAYVIDSTTGELEEIDGFVVRPNMAAYHRHDLGYGYRSNGLRVLHDGDLNGVRDRMTRRRWARRMGDAERT